MSSKLLLNCPDCIKKLGRKDDYDNNETLKCKNCGNRHQASECMKTFPTIKRADGSVRVMRDDGYEE